jgi:AraC-like DNA-binding protein
MFLRNHRSLWTSDPVTAFDGVTLRQPGFKRLNYKKSEGWKFCINFCNLGTVGLSYGDMGAWSHYYEGDDYVRLVFPISGEHSAHFQRTTREISGNLCFLPPDGYWADTMGSQALLLRLERPSVVKALEALTSSIDVTQRLARLWHRPTHELAAFAHLLRYVAVQLDQSEAMLDQPAFTRVYEDLIYLHAAQALIGEDVIEGHDFNQPALRRCLDYIEAHFSDCLTVSEVAKAGGVGVRSMQLHFRKHLGQSFLMFLTERRLLAARQMLLSGQEGLSVTKIAMSCGFNHLGDFARLCKNAFGEKPSAALERMRRRGSGEAE